jgi:hypothetical protein
MHPWVSPARVSRGSERERGGGTRIEFGKGREGNYGTFGSVVGGLKEITILKSNSFLERKSPFPKLAGTDASTEKAKEVEVEANRLNSVIDVFMVNLAVWKTPMEGWLINIRLGMVFNEEVVCIRRQFAALYNR